MYGVLPCPVPDHGSNPVRPSPGTSPGDGASVRALLRLGESKQYTSLDPETNQPGDSKIVLIYVLIGRFWPLMD